MVRQACSSRSRVASVHQALGEVVGAPSPAPARRPTGTRGPWPGQASARAPGAAREPRWAARHGARGRPRRRARRGAPATRWPRPAGRATRAGAPPPTCCPPRDPRCLVGRRRFSSCAYSAEARSTTARRCEPDSAGSRRAGNFRGVPTLVATSSLTGPQSKPEGRTRLTLVRRRGAARDWSPRPRAMARQSSVTTPSSRRVRSCASSTTTRSKSAKACRDLAVPQEPDGPDSRRELGKASAAVPSSAVATARIASAAGSPTASAPPPRSR